jgi:hypothetical protein
VGVGCASDHCVALGTEIVQSIRAVRLVLQCLFMACFCAVGGPGDHAAALGTEIVPRIRAAALCCNAIDHTAALDTEIDSSNSVVGLVLQQRLIACLLL